ncbi:MAG: sugar transporter [Bacteroidaceae bacterium]|nr:sugar transporter [Bacteroidaceae bacterium]
MKSDSRTYKSIKNAQITTLYFFIQMVLGFWSRKIFYDYLGSEVLGLDTTAQSLLHFLNLAESGVGAAVAYFLYAPFYNNDTSAINKIVAIQGWIYRRIATLILALSALLMCFFPLIFSGIKMPLWYAYATFCVLLIGNLLDYYVNYRQSVLSADQKTYKVTKVTQMSSIVFRIMLILWLPVAQNPFALYLGTTFLGYMIGALWLNHVLRKEYPWLKAVNTDGRTLLKEFPEIVTKTKQLFIHRIAGFLVFSCTPLIMYSFSTLTIVAYYGNYLAVTDKADKILTQAFSSTNAAIGNLIASKDKNKMLSVFWELTDSRLCISTIVIATLLVVTEPFISIWLTQDYLLGGVVLYIILAQVWLNINRTAVDGFKDGFGLVQDVAAPILEGTISLMVSIVCGFFLGISGVLMGGIVSGIFVVYGWKPYYLFSRGFEINAFSNFYVPYLKRILLSAGSIGLVFYASSVYAFKPQNYLAVFIYAIIVGLSATVVTFSLFSRFTSGMKSFNSRMVVLVKSIFS